MAENESGDTKKIALIKKIKRDINSVSTDKERLDLFKLYANTLKEIKDKESDEFQLIYAQNEDFYDEINNSINGVPSESMFINVGLHKNIGNKTKELETYTKYFQNIAISFENGSITIEEKRAVFRISNIIFQMEKYGLNFSLAANILNHINPGKYAIVYSLLHDF